MKVLLLNIDSKLPNIALHKIAMWHEQQGDTVLWGSPLEIYNSDKVYVSCIFTKNKSKVDNLIGLHPDIIAGGTGYDLIVKLPPEIDIMRPLINYGFTTRGCIRKCAFCVVPDKEGYIRVEGNLLDIWDGKAKVVTLYDNNILALPNHFKMICQQSIDLKITLDFNQGLDHRLLTQDICDWLAKISHKEYHFAFDNPAYYKSVKRAIGILNDVGIKRSIWYVLVGFDTTFKEDLERLNFLQNYGQRAFVQRYDNFKGKADYQALADWANQHNFFATKSFAEFLQLRKDRRALAKKLRLS